MFSGAPHRGPGSDEDDDIPELTEEEGEHWDVLGCVWVGWDGVEWGGRGAKIGSSRREASEYWEVLGGVGWGQGWQQQEGGE